jgi:hypothetical protein
MSKKLVKRKIDLADLPPIENPKVIKVIKERASGSWASRCAGPHLP